MYKQLECFARDPNSDMVAVEVETPEGSRPIGLVPRDDRVVSGDFHVLLRVIVIDEDAGGPFAQVELRYDARWRLLPGCAQLLVYKDSLAPELPPNFVPAQTHRELANL